MKKSMFVSISAWFFMVASAWFIFSALLQVVMSSREWNFNNLSSGVILLGLPISILVLAFNLFKRKEWARKVSIVLLIPVVLSILYWVLPKFIADVPVSNDGGRAYAQRGLTAVVILVQFCGLVFSVICSVLIKELCSKRVREEFRVLKSQDAA